MNASIMHKAFGVSKQDCLDMRYEDNNIVLQILLNFRNRLIITIHTKG
jgi:hypothetical protein